MRNDHPDDLPPFAGGFTPRPHALNAHDAARKGTHQLADLATPLAPLYQRLSKALARFDRTRASAGSNTDIKTGAACQAVFHHRRWGGVTAVDRATGTMCLIFDKMDAPADTIHIHLPVCDALMIAAHITRYANLYLAETVLAESERAKRSADRRAERDRG